MKKLYSYINAVCNCPIVMLLSMANWRARFIRKYLFILQNYD